MSSFLGRHSSLAFVPPSLLPASKLPVLLVVPPRLLVVVVNVHANDSLHARSSTDLYLLRQRQ